MRTATLFLFIALVPIFAAPQDPAKPTEAPSAQQKPRFEATPATVASGQATQLTWTVEGATSVNIQPVVGSVPATGSSPVTPAETTTYTLTAVAPTGNLSLTATVTVNPVTGTTPQTGDAEGKTPAGSSTTTTAVPAPPMTEGAPKAPGTVPSGTAIDPGKMGAPRNSTNTPKGAPVDYRAFILGAEDQISILVYGSPEFSGSHMIRPDGKITLNFIGEVMAADLTPEQLGIDIKDKLKKYVVDPDVSVSVLTVKSKYYFIQGEVNKTGQFPLVVATRVLEALVNAGGFKDFANKKKIVIMRGTDARGTERLKFNYKEVIAGKHLEQNIYLKHGDIIIVH